MMMQKKLLVKTAEPTLSDMASQRDELLKAFHRVLALPRNFTSPEEFYFDARKIAEESIKRCQP
jgi:hypothetical protein